MPSLMERAYAKYELAIKAIEGGYEVIAGRAAAVSQTGEPYIEFNISARTPELALSGLVKAVQSHRWGYGSKFLYWRVKPDYPERVRDFVAGIDLWVMRCRLLITDKMSIEDKSIPEGSWDPMIMPIAAMRQMNDFSKRRSFASKENKKA